MVTSPKQARSHAKQLANPNNPGESLSLWGWLIVAFTIIAVLAGVAWKTVTPAVGGLLQGLSGGRIRTFNPQNTSSGDRVVDF
jgi:uncharacterized membrane protein